VHLLSDNDVSFTNSTCIDDSGDDVFFGVLGFNCQDLNQKNSSLSNMKATKKI